MRDVTDEYKKRMSSDKNGWIFEDGYKTDDHIEEIRVAKWIQETIGGSIVLLAETDGIYMGKRADYLWNKRLWELKTIRSAKAADSAVRKALQQIRDKPGGIILRVENSKDSTTRIESVVKERIRKSGRFSVDVMNIRNWKIEKVVRYEQ